MTSTATTARTWVIVREDTDAAHGWAYDHQPVVGEPYATPAEARTACDELDQGEGYYIVTQREVPAPAADRRVALVARLDAVHNRREDEAAELARLRAVDQAARALVETCDRRWAAGWTKTPVKDIERLRAALEGTR